MNYKQFLVKNKVAQLEFLKFLTFFLILNFFHAVLVKVLNLISANQNRNMHIFYKKKIPKLNYIHLKLFFGGLD